ncbi:MAG: DNA mismatch repair protein MutT [Candidatus Komeilibacteria bacterium CG10_big_fil_rev_8_21_14_0_10_41_13]|uniref:DNA mismatch repair protein MutT n=1 Tax=Candidatus Komeilibacteria bacterium CG10_big_fil_rev_8_21_14_0_10_41_13 TaxID=1974476 RepID=A0A2M6WBQ5_9BACT|nr:MAG: DNA mismatch repair protein MutT [Candidatus Komeilibacteria bacterium CG10_big_fil_rev_8_21_14_0_10_41_13]
MEPITKIGVAAIIRNDNKVLIGKRKNAHGEGCWAFPGGHLEFNEDPQETAIRETLEETGIRIKNLKVGPYTNDKFEKEGKHYITLFIIADYDSGEAKVLEPEKCEKWDWFSWDNLPEPLFLPFINLLKQNFNPFER